MKSVSIGTNHAYWTIGLTNRIRLYILDMCATELRAMRQIQQSCFKLHVVQQNMRLNGKLLGEEQRK